MKTTEIISDQVVTAIYVEHGSFENSDGDEVASYYVYPGDDDGKPVSGHHHEFFSWGAAHAWAEKLARNFCVDEVVDV